MGYSNIMMIDDDDDDQEIFLTALQKVTNSISCIAVNNGCEALQKLKSKQIQPDLIFLDLNMPVMNGQQFLMEIKKDEELKNIPIIIFSTSSHSPTIALTKLLGAHDFITKPDKFEDLVNILTSVLC
jgi:CheY-like chemotaxis protein